MADQVVNRKEYLRKNREMIARVTAGFKVCPVCKTRVSADDKGNPKGGRYAPKGEGELSFVCRQGSFYIVGGQVGWNR